MILTRCRSLTAIASLLAVALGLLLQQRPAGAKRRRAAPPAPRVVKRLSLTQRTRSPTFDALPSVSALDRGRLLLVGGGLFAEQETFFAVKLTEPKMPVIRLRAPVTGFLERTGLLEEHQQPVHEHYRVDRLLFYDTGTREAALEVADARATDGVKRHFYLHWDLARQRIHKATLVARTAPGATWASPLPIGYDHARRLYYYARDVRAGEGSARKITIVAFKGGKPRVVTQLTSRWKLHRQAYLDAPRQRALLLEYGELGGHSAPMGHLIDLRRGKVRRFAIPVTAYGAVFSEDGRRLFIYSAQTGALRAYDVRGEAPRSAGELAAGRRGHALGRLSADQLLLIRNTGLQLVDARRMRKGRFIGIKAIYSDRFSHVQGSLVLPGLALVRNGDLLHFAEL